MTDNASDNFKDLASGGKDLASGDCLIAELTELTVIVCEGTDAGTFLQAQLSNDVMRLGEGDSQQAAWCDAKGRTLAVLRVFRRDSAYCLLVPKELSYHIIKRLQLFVLRSKVKITENPEGLQILAVFGASAADVVNTLARAPVADDVSTEAGVQWLGLPGPEPSYIALASDAQRESLWQELSQRCDSVGNERWRLDRILAGQPQVYSRTQGAFVPQMLNLHWLSGIDFHKGCYPGQEVVARLQYRGRLTRRMMLARLESGQPVATGTQVNGKAGENLGQVVDAARFGDAEQRLLAVLKTDAELGGAHIQDAPLTPMKLPYPTPDDPDQSDQDA